MNIQFIVCVSPCVNKLVAADFIFCKLEYWDKTFGFFAFYINVFFSDLACHFEGSNKSKMRRWCFLSIAESGNFVLSKKNWSSNVYASHSTTCDATKPNYEELQFSENSLCKFLCKYWRWFHSIIFSGSFLRKYLPK